MLLEAVILRLVHTGYKRLNMISKNTQVVRLKNA